MINQYKEMLFFQVFPTLPLDKLKANLPLSKKNPIFFIFIFINSDHFISKTSSFFISFIRNMIFISFVPESNLTCHLGKLPSNHRRVMQVSPFAKQSIPKFSRTGLSFGSPHLQELDSNLDDARVCRILYINIKLTIFYLQRYFEYYAMK